MYTLVIIFTVNIDILIMFTYLSFNEHIVLLVVVSVVSPVMLFHIRLGQHDLQIETPLMHCVWDPNEVSLLLLLLLLFPLLPLCNTEDVLNPEEEKKSPRLASSCLVFLDRQTCNASRWIDIFFNRACTRAPLTLLSNLSIFLLLVCLLACFQVLQHLQEAIEHRTTHLAPRQGTTTATTTTTTTTSCLCSTILRIDKLGKEKFIPSFFSLLLLCVIVFS